MKGIVIFGSRYGTTKRYAEELARRIGLQAVRFDAIGDINTYDIIIYLGALYAGGIMGLRKTFSGLADCPRKRIVIATVGLADPTDPENVATIEANMRRQLPEGVFEHARVFHLRGGIDYAELGLGHRAMMRLLVKKAKGLPKERQNAETRALVETYGQRVSFVDLACLDQMVAAV